MVAKLEFLQQDGGVAITDILHGRDQRWVGSTALSTLDKPGAYIITDAGDATSIQERADVEPGKLRSATKPQTLMNEGEEMLLRLSTEPPEHLRVTHLGENPPTEDISASHPLT